MPAQMPSPDQIACQSRAELCALWQSWFKTPAPAQIHRPRLVQILAYEAQARTLRGLDRQTRRAIARVQKELHAPEPRALAPGLKPGARLVRVWNGQRHVVEVTSEGFVWEGRRYRALSAIAKAITGAHWSGPRFFGLTGERHGQA